jgi:hypothetical protein
VWTALLGYISTTTVWKGQTPEYGMATSATGDQNKVQNVTNSEKMMLIAFGILKGQYWNIIKRRAQQ